MVENQIGFLERGRPENNCWTTGNRFCSNHLLRGTTQFLEEVDMSKKPFHFDEDHEGKTFSRIDFDYEGRNWTGKITHEISSYAKKPTYFINVKLPLDSFIVTDRYGGDVDNIRETAETFEFVQSITKIADFEWEAKFNYKEREDRVEFYLWNIDEALPIRQCLTIKFEYGTYNYYNHKQVWKKKDYAQLWKKE
eukprot:TRINITY_DN3403_c0_g1_i4.p1 TRINITY_DN3403_c0_g1~~TRINITY_DN3403_c0_g1_i4.p1  ORF type:complete len:194 (-),score=27.43 TRINITY_DN3403_c0_g1_i4:6-587(-)